MKNIAFACIVAVAFAYDHPAPCAINNDHPKIEVIKTLLPNVEVPPAGTGAT
jgi:hypothetical protein